MLTLTFVLPYDATLFDECGRYNSEYYAHYFNLIDLGLESALQRAEASRIRDQNYTQQQVDKYKVLKRRVREYQKYVNEKMAKCRADRQSSEEYCRRVISELLGKVSVELRKLECERRCATAPVANGTAAVNCQPAAASTFIQGIDELQRQVNCYVQGLSNFSK